MTFSEWLKLMQGSSGAHGWLQPTIDVHDTLQGAKVIAESIFGANAPSDLVLEVFDRLHAEQLRRAKEEVAE